MIKKKVKKDVKKKKRKNFEKKVTRLTWLVIWRGQQISGGEGILEHRKAVLFLVFLVVVDCFMHFSLGRCRFELAVVVN